MFCFNIVSSETIKFSCLFCLIKRNSKLHRPVVFKSIDDEVDNSLPNYKNNFSGISNGEKDESFSNHENDPNKEILDDEDEEDSSLPNYENYSIETPSKGTDFTGFFLPGLYGIVNIKTNKIYIGQSYNLASRLSDHMRNLSQSTHSSIKLQADWNNYGSDQFRFHILEIGPEWADREKRIDAENSYIAQHIRNCYNLITDSFPEEQPIEDSSKKTKPKKKKPPLNANSIGIYYKDQKFSSFREAAESTEINTRKIRTRTLLDDPNEKD